MPRPRHSFRALLLACAVALAAHAHNPDTSYARISLASNIVECRFTYDLATLQRILPLATNGETRITHDELRAAAPRLYAFLRENIFVEFNSSLADFGEELEPTWPADAGESIAQGDWNQRLVGFTFRNELVDRPEDVALTFDFFGRLGDRHAVLGLFVCNGQEYDVIFTRLEPDFLFDTGYVAAPVGQAARFLKLGIEHIFRGYDHILFLVGLIVVGRFLDLVKIVTSFTVAHTLTLILATLRIVMLPSRLVETGIALTIIYVAAENLWKGTPQHRWRLTFGFGLIHGFGFANVLREMGLPATGLMRSLLCFNLGVETGQIILLCILWPLIWWLNRQRWAPRARQVISMLILLLGSAWFCERAFGWRFMPF